MYGDWSLEEDGTVNASMVFARRVGDIRSHEDLIGKVRGLVRIWRECLFQSVWRLKMR